MKEEVRLVAMSTQKRRERNVRHRNSHSVSKVGAEHVVVGIGWFPLLLMNGLDGKKMSLVTTRTTDSMGGTHVVYALTKVRPKFH